MEPDGSGFIGPFRRPWQAEGDGVWTGPGAWCWRDSGSGLTGPDGALDLGARTERARRPQPEEETRGGAISPGEKVRRGRRALGPGLVGFGMDARAVRVDLSVKDVWPWSQILGRKQTFANLRPMNRVLNNTCLSTCSTTRTWKLKIENES